MKAAIACFQFVLSFAKISQRVLELLSGHDFPTNSLKRAQSRQRYRGNYVCTSSDGAIFVLSIWKGP